MNASFNDFLNKYQVLELMCNEHITIDKIEELDPVSFYAEQLPSDVKEKFKTIMQFHDRYVYDSESLDAVPSTTMDLLDEIINYVLQSILDLLKARMSDDAFVKKYPNIDVDTQFQREKRHIIARLERTLKVYSLNAPKIIIDNEQLLLKRAIKNPFKGIFMDY